MKKVKDSAKNLAVVDSPEVVDSNIVLTQPVEITKILYKDIISLPNLIKGLDRTKNNVSPGLDGETKTDITEKRLQQLHLELVAQTYQAKSSRSVGIPKPDGGVRYLGIATQIDKVVQGAILSKLEPVLEKVFLKESYGFRPGLSCHHALKEIKYGWKAVTWIINVDISKCFDKLNHAFLLEKLSNYCDQPTVELIRKLIKVGYVDIHNLNRRADYSTMGVPQGSLISPILCNLYLHELDTYVVNELIPLYTKGVARQKNPDYASRFALTESEKKIISESPRLKKAIMREKHNKFVMAGRFSASNGQDPNYRRLFYMRYADDFIIGFIGPRVVAEQIENLIKDRLKMIHLEANESKSKVHHSSDTGILYLGMFIRYFHQNKIVQELEEPVGEVEKQVPKLRAQAINVAHFRVPVDRILKRLVDRGVAKVRGDGTVRGTAYLRICMLEDAKIVQRFNSIIRGLLNYYSCINHRSDLWKIFAILRKACALTLAHKHKMGSAARVYNKFGASLTIRTATGGEAASLEYPKSLKTNIDFRLRSDAGLSPEIADIELNKVQGSTHTNIKSGDKCQHEGCDITENLEAHHLNPMSNLSKRKDLTPFEKALIQRKRKVVMLCKKHHNELHRKGLLAKKSRVWPPAEANNKREDSTKTESIGPVLAGTEDHAPLEK